MGDDEQNKSQKSTSPIGTHRSKTMKKSKFVEKANLNIVTSNLKPKPQFRINLKVPASPLTGKRHTL
jgi:hypothetical protein